MPRPPARTWHAEAVAAGVIVHCRRTVRLAAVLGYIDVIVNALRMLLIGPNHGAAAPAPA
jgi:hypothetical protein